MDRQFKTSWAYPEIPSFALLMTSYMTSCSHKGPSDSLRCAEEHRRGGATSQRFHRGPGTKSSVSPKTLEMFHQRPNGQKTGTKGENSQSHDLRNIWGTHQESQTPVLESHSPEEPQINPNHVLTKKAKVVCQLKGNHRNPKSTTMQQQLLFHTTYYWSG